MSKAKTTGTVKAPEPVQRKNVLAALHAIKKLTGASPIGLGAQETWPHIPSNIIQIDHLLGGSPLKSGTGLVCPGYPRGRMIEVYGAESSGKTTLALNAIANVRKMGGVALFLDFENALHYGYAETIIGAPFNDTDTLCFAPDTLEDGFKMIYIAIKSGFDLVVVDSVASMIPKKELEKKLGDPSAIGALARELSTNIGKMVQWQKKDPQCCVMLLNQIRSLISSTGGDETTAGGKALKFYATHRLKLTRIRSDFWEKVDPLTRKKKRIPYGNVTQIKVVKNKLDGKQGYTAEVFIRYGSGLDEYMSMIETAVPRGLIKKDGSSYVYAGEKFKGKEKVRKYLIDNSRIAMDLRTKIQQALLAEKPEALSGEDEIEDDDLVSDTQRAMGDDDLADGGVDEAAVDNVLAESESEGS